MKKLKFIAVAGILLIMSSCKTPQITGKIENRNLPADFGGQKTAESVEKVNWEEYFQDPYLASLIDTALNKNQELNIMMQEIEISKNEVLARKGEYLPFVGYRGGMGLDKVARYTNIGAMEATTDIKEGKEMPEPLPDFLGGLYATWELDIWHKLRNARKAAFNRYLGSQEARNFMVTNLVAEIANSYYELLALDNQLEIVQQNIEIQSNALEIVKIQKEAARVTQLAVKRFEAEVYKTRSLQYEIRQDIVEIENRINFLTGRFPQPILRSSGDFVNRQIVYKEAGLPAQLLANRPDIRQAEYNLEAAKLDVDVARANFYPSLGISAALGLRAFNPIYLANVPKSLLTSLAGDLIGPLINKRAITATYLNANAAQIQTVYEYEKTILGAYLEVVNQQANIENLAQSFALKNQQVDALVASIGISNDLFKNARADYMEVLLTQREALESRFELIETRRQQMNARVNIYRALGGGWN
ncbi:TolC family protein [Jiulongibacter sediminis]|uniref:RND transporter n=1 Tax=Jiulongibacter sediminis TaxID=1605367 RepID=A0A0P7C0H9_9BACT|nr:TolC family protein [Jiulongibacter sediminis]KPM48077.1 RND transporter [Jiulongibacter sediminis]TBX24258.1 RND transporter [Jiulongibacter sediminis]